MARAICQGVYGKKFGGPLASRPPGIGAHMGIGSFGQRYTANPRTRARTHAYGKESGHKPREGAQDGSGWPNGAPWAQSCRTASGRKGGPFAAAWREGGKEATIMPTMDASNNHAMHPQDATRTRLGCGRDAEDARSATAVSGTIRSCAGGIRSQAPSNPHLISIPINSINTEEGE